MSTKSEAKASNASKRARMGLSSAFPVATTPKETAGPLSNTETAWQIPPVARKHGGRVGIPGGKAKGRLDRKGAAGQGMTAAIPPLDTGAPSSQMPIQGGGMKKGGVIKRANGGAVKGRKGQTTVNVIVASAPNGGAGAGGPPMPPVTPPMGGPPPPPPPPPPGPASAGMGAPPPTVINAGGGGGGPPMPMRASGGRVDKSAAIDDGAGGGAGRLEKIKKYGSNAGPTIKGPGK